MSTIFVGLLVWFVISIFVGIGMSLWLKSRSAGD